MSPEIKFQNIRKYLLLKGWSEISFNDKLKKFVFGSESPPIELIVPNDESLSDYFSRVNDLMLALSIIEGREQEMILNEILYIGYDLMKVRLQSKIVKDGGLALEDFRETIDWLSYLLKYGACSEIVTKSQYTRPYDDAIDLVQNCQFVKNEAGSFVMFIKIPLGETYIQNIEEEVEEQGDYLKDLGRRTIARIINGIEKAKDLNLENEEEFKSSYDKTLNKNVCDAIAKLINEENEVSLEFSAKWNTAYNVDNYVPISTKIDSQTHHKRFARMSSYLKNIPEEQLITIKGRIPAIHLPAMEKSDDPDAMREEKSLITVLEPTLKRKINMLLDFETFEQACDALKSFKIVSVTGRLNKRANKWFLDDPSEFQVL